MHSFRSCSSCTDFVCDRRPASRYCDQRHPKNETASVTALHEVYAFIRTLAMNPPVIHVRRSALTRRQALVLADAQGTVVAVDRGSVWITQERDPRDIVLSKGMRFEIDRPGRTVVGAEAPSVLRLLVPERWRQRAARALRRAIGRWSAQLIGRAAPYY
jgi:hypothetical protein